MNLNPIYWLRLTKVIKTKIDGHYVFKKNDYFKVFISKKINGIECTHVSDSNIKGQSKPQFIAEVYHKVDLDLHKFTQPNECHIYHAEHPKEIFNLEQSFKPFKEIIELKD